MPQQTKPPPETEIHPTEGLDTEPPTSEDTEFIDGIVAAEYEQGMKEVEKFLAARPSNLEKLRILGNIGVHQFGSTEFWNEMIHPISTETSQGHSEVRVINRELLLTNPDAPQVEILPPLGTSTAGGHNAEAANYFAERGYVVWMPSAIGMEGSAKAHSYFDRSIRTISRHFDEAIEDAATQLGIDVTPRHKFGSSQGGGSAIGMHYRDKAHGRETGKVVAEAVCSGDNGFDPRRLAKLGLQFLVEEPVAALQHITGHEDPFKRAMQLAGSVNLSPRPLANTLASGAGILFGPDHGAMTSGNYPLDPDQVLVIVYEGDRVAADEWDNVLNVKRRPGVHMQILSGKARDDAHRFFSEESVTPTNDSAAAA
jgi:hypothetical protein